MNKVYILLFFSKTWTELLGVYSTEEKAKNAYNIFLSHMNGSSSCEGLTILVREIDENLATSNKNEL